MAINRREFVLFTSVGLLAGCAGAHESNPPERAAALAPGGGVDTGPLRQYAAEGIYTHYRESHRFFVVRACTRVYARSSICPHRACEVDVSGGCFECVCHGSVFSLDGKLVKGPARRDLPGLAVERDVHDHLIVYPARLLTANAGNGTGAFVTL